MRLLDPNLIIEVRTRSLGSCILGERQRLFSNWGRQSAHFYIYQPEKDFQIVNASLFAQLHWQGVSEETVRSSSQAAT